MKAAIMSLRKVRHPSNYVPGRYTPKYSSNCADEIQSGDTVRCTITNKYNQFIPESYPN